MSSWSPTKYKTRNWPSYNTALKQRGSLAIWFDAEMPWHAAPTGKRGRQPEFSDAAIQVCLTMKVLFGCCQTNANSSQFPGIGNLLGCADAAPLGKSGGAVELEI